MPFVAMNNVCVSSESQHDARRNAQVVLRDSPDRWHNAGKSTEGTAGASREFVEACHEVLALNEAKCKALTHFRVDAPTQGHGKPARSTAYKRTWWRPIKRCGNAPDKDLSKWNDPRVRAIGKSWPKQKAEEIDIRTGVSDLGNMIAAKIDDESYGFAQDIRDGGVSAIEIETRLARCVRIDACVGVAEENLGSSLLRKSAEATEEEQPNGTNTLRHFGTRPRVHDTALSAVCFGHREPAVDAVLRQPQ